VGAAQRRDLPQHRCRPLLIADDGEGHGGRGVATNP
jgi:hypothetical protein